MQLDLSAPKVITFSIAVVIALIASIVHYAHISVPYVTTGFTILFVGIFDSGRRQRVSRIVVKAPRDSERAWAEASLSPRGIRKSR